MAVSIKISDSSREALAELAKVKKLPLSKLLDLAIKELQRAEFWRQAQEAYARIRDNPDDWAEELKDREFWESHSSELLEDESEVWKKYYPEDFTDVVKTRKPRRKKSR